MIQVCSQCSTRWNVREKQRTWCPRCNGTLLAPQVEAPQPDRWSPTGHQVAPQLPSGYRWIAVRPGAPPPPPRKRRPLSPTPRYATIPRWGLVDQIDPAAVAQTSGTRRVPTPRLVRATLLTTIIALGAAAAVHAVRYVLLLINRNTLLHPLIAGAGLWLGTVAAVVASVATAGCAAVLTWWLVTRRAAAFAHLHRPATRRDWALWLGCLLPPWIALSGARIEASVLGASDFQLTTGWAAFIMALLLLPLLGMAWPLTYLTELARIEGQEDRLRTPIWVWAVAALVSAATSVFATLTSSARDAQGIADNTVAATLAYVLAVVAVVAATRVYDGFERRPVERPAHRWVVVTDGPAAQSSPQPVAESAGEELESKPQEPAA